MPTVKLLIDGEFVDSATREWRDIVNPATQKVLDGDLDAFIQESLKQGV